jgi:hypothetical protein
LSSGFAWNFLFSKFALEYHEISRAHQSFFISQVKNLIHFKTTFICKNFFFQNPYHFYTKWLTFKSLANGSRLNQFSKYFKFFLVEPSEASFTDLKLSDIKNSIYPKKYAYCLKYVFFFKEFRNPYTLEFYFIN